MTTAHKIKRASYAAEGNRDKDPCVALIDQLAVTGFDAIMAPAYLRVMPAKQGKGGAVSGGWRLRICDGAEYAWAMDMWRELFERGAYRKIEATVERIAKLRAERKREIYREWRKDREAFAERHKLNCTNYRKKSGEDQKIRLVTREDLMQTAIYTRTMTAKRLRGEVKP